MFGKFKSKNKLGGLALAAAGVASLWVPALAPVVAVFGGSWEAVFGGLMWAGARDAVDSGVKLYVSEMAKRGP